MDLLEINQIMLEKGIASDPAFEALAIAIKTMPDLNGCPLGLYYPGTATIVLPRDGIEAALLHELGHRHGHYHHGILKEYEAEAYAENYRKGYQGGRVLLYMGDHFERLPKFGHLFEEGEKGVLEIALARPLAVDEMAAINCQLNSYGEPPPKIRYDGNGSPPFVRFEFTKGVDWLTLIGTGMVASVIFTVGAIGYAVYKVSDEMPWIVPVTLWGTGIFFLLRAMVRQKAKKST